MSKSANTKSAKTRKSQSGAALSPLDDSGEPSRKRGHRYKFCFVIPSYAGKRNADNERHPMGVYDLGRCLDSIAEQTDPDCRVIIVNDGHSPEMRALCLEFQAATPHIPMRYIEAPYRGKRGGHESVNIALTVLPENVEFVAIVNPDNILRPTYIEKMYSPDHDILTCMVKMNDLPGIVLSGDTFARGKIDRLNYAVRADIAVNTKHKMHMDADCDYVLDCVSMSENGIHYVEEILAEHN